MEPGFNEILYFIFLGLFNSIGEIFILLACLYYIFRMGINIDNALMLAGCIIKILIGVFGMISSLYFKIWGMQLVTTISYVAKAFSVIGSLLFVIGFIILIQRVITKIKK